VIFSTTDVCGDKPFSETLSSRPNKNVANPDLNGPLITAAKLSEHLTDPNWVIVDCRFDLADPEAGRGAYATGHIPGACYASLDRDLAGPVAPDGRGGRHPLPDPAALSRAAADWGIDSDSHIIAYDAAGGAIAARLWWLFRWAGHRQVSVLDGGLEAWIAAGQPLTRDNPPQRTGNWVAGDAHLPTRTADQVSAELAADEIVLLDARAPARYAGRHEPLDVRAGHVPGALNTPFQDNLAVDNRFRTKPELLAYYRAIVEQDGRAGEMQGVVCMCGSGVTACHTLLALEAAGYPGASLYTGSWSDWISDSRRPVATDER
jgi:thiosulfate/3-mercaptopyruvate sulfurtransferase